MNIDERIEYLRKKGMAKRALSRWYKKWWGVLLIIVISLLLIYALSFAFLMIRLMNNPDELGSVMSSRITQQNQKNQKAQENYLANIRLVEGLNSNFLGPQEADFTIVVFSDFTCPYCKEASDTITKLAVKYGSKLKIIIRDFPILSDDSVDLAMVARCAGEQDKYWPMYYKLFEFQKDYKSLGIASIAQSANITDLDKFYNCIDQEKYLNDILKDASDAQFLKINGTPAWFLNGSKVGEGAIPFSTWDAFLTENIKD
jgi:protein-disulfide isomerase